MEDRYSFADSPIGIGHMMYTFARLKTAGYTVRRVTGTVILGSKGNVTIYGSLHTVIATPPPRPNREARGCNV